MSHLARLRSFWSVFWSSPNAVRRLHLRDLEDRNAASSVLVDVVPPPTPYVDARLIDDAPTVSVIRESAPDDDSNETPTDSGATPPAEMNQGQADAFASLESAPLDTPTGLTDTYFVTADNLPDNSATPPASNPPASPASDPTASGNAMAGSSGNTSLVNVAGTPPSNNTPQAPSNPPPVVPPPGGGGGGTLDAIIDTYQANFYGPTTVGAGQGVLANDINTTGSPMSAVLFAGPSHGSIVLAGNGGFTYTPFGGVYAGGDSFTYVAVAGGLTSNIGTVQLGVGPLGGTTSGPTFTWTQTPPGTPTITNPGNQTGVEGQAVNLAIVATGTGALHYAALELPTGLSIDRATGIISGTLSGTAGEDLGGIYATTIIVSEADGGSTTTQFTWSIVPAMTLPNPGDQSNAVGDSVSVQLNAGGPASDAFSYSATGLPSGLTVDATGMISGTIAPSASASNAVTATVTDTVTGATASTTFAWTVTAPVYQAPAMDPIDDQSDVAGDQVAVSVSAYGSNTLTYSATGLPTDLSIDPNSGEITGTLSASAFSTTPYQVTVTATDGTNSASQSFAWSVAAIGIPAPGDQSNSVGDTVSLSMTGQDVMGGTLSYSASGLPSGLSINSTGNISGTIAPSLSGPTSYAVTVTATDGTYTTSQTFNWSIQPATMPGGPGSPAGPGSPGGPGSTGSSGPVVTATPFAATEGNDTGSIIAASFTADSSTDAGAYSATITWGDGSTGTGLIDGQNGSFTVSADHTYVAPGAYALSVTVTDLDGNTTTSSGVETVSAATVAPIPGFHVGALVGQAGEVVTEFNYGNPSAPAASFSAQIIPGDGSAPVTGTVTSLGYGLFAVSLPHGYALSSPKHDTVTITDPHGVQMALPNTVEVGKLVVGEPAHLTVETFDLGDPSAQASSYTATISWGDGSASEGTVSGTGGHFTVTGDHNYLIDSIDLPGGVYPVSVALSTGGQVVAGARNGVVVTRPTSTSQIARVVEKADGSVAELPIMAFEVPNATDTAAEFAATIDWGDGTTSAGIVSGGTGVFEVGGRHTFADHDSHVVTITLRQSWQSFDVLLVLPTFLAFVAPPAKSALRVTDLSFGGGYQFSGRDIGTAPYDGSKQWNASTGSVPYAYVRNAKLTVSKVTFQVVDPTMTGTVSIKGTIWDYTAGRTPRKLGTVQKANVQIFNGTVQATNLVSDNALSKDVTYFDKLAIVWSVMLPDATTETAGVTSTRVYVLFAKPTGDLVTAAGKSQFFLPTMADVGCRAAEDYKVNTGAYPQTEKQMLDAIWAKFETRSIQRAQDGKVLQYYGTWKTPTKIGTTNKASLDLIRKADGECTDWAVFLLATMGAQGITGKDSTVPARFSVIEPTNALEVKRGGIMIKGWTFAGKAGPGMYPYTNVVTKLANGTTPGDQAKPGGDRQYRFTKKSPVTYDAPLPGQGQLDPPSLFKNHLVVRIKIGGVDQIYDPSYGVQPYTSLQDFQNRAIASFYIMLPKDDGSGIMGIRRNVAGAALGVKFTTK